MGLGEAGVDDQRPAVGNDRVFQLALAFENVAQVDMGRRMAWIDGQRPAVGSGGVFQVAPDLLDGAQVVVGFDEIGVDIEGPAERFAGIIKLALAGQGRRQLAQHLSRPRLGVKDLAVKRLGLGQTPGLMVVPGVFEGGVDIGFVEVVHRRWFWGLRFLRRIGIFSRVLTKATMSSTWSRVMENSAA